ncbi:MAG TPA: alpha/beta fold hydrolase [Anaeromyxobacteraceae bacterium]|jgi:pimeloyl-ACP methyl ester carboxylesterase|nr:alpha/beta fold hydrolase [Anaeromyxobacteraceae bacterium]
MPTTDAVGAKIHYQDTGSGKDVVLLLHAFPLHSGMWSRQIAALAPRYRVIAPDYPGLGKSAPRSEPSTMEALAEQVLEVLGAARVDRAVVAGLSMGGYLAFEIHRRRPGLFRGLALCDTRCGADTPEGAANRETFARNALEKGLHWVADEMTPKLLRPQPDPAAVKEVRHLIGQGTPAGVAAAQRGMARRPDSTPTLATIACPTLVVVGEEDTLTPPPEAEKMAAGIKGARLVKIPGAGHMPNVEQPAAFDAALLEFIAGLPK